MSDNRTEIRAAVRELARLTVDLVGRPASDADHSTATIARGDLCRICDEVAEQAAEIARLTAELAAARAVPADVEAAILALVGVTIAETSNPPHSSDTPSPPMDGAYARLKATISRAIAEARQPATVGGLLAHLKSGEPFTSPRWLAGHVLRVDAATGRLWRLDYNDPDELHLTRYVLSDRAFSISDVMADDYAVVADTPVMDHAWRTRPASRGPLPKGG